MTEVDYLKLKIVSLEYQQICLKAELVTEKAKAKYHEALFRAGLDPDIDYVMNDATHSIMPVTQEKG